jgi:hypothetical protein
MGDPRRTSFDFAFLAGAARFAAGSDMERLLRLPTEYGIGLAVRYTLGDPYALPGFAPIVGFRVGQLSWRYLQGILIDRDGTIDQVSHDAVTYYAGYAGLGTTFVRTGHLEVGVTAVAGLRRYDELSNQGLVNDLFLRTTFTELRLETRVAL